MAFPQFFTKPDFNESSEILLSPLNNIHENIVVLYDITKKKSFGKLQIRSIRTNPTYIIFCMKMN